MPRVTRFTAIAFSALGLLLVLHALLYFPMRVDDAFILMRYAENLAAGHGPVFNVGERVEGFTSPAMVVLEAAFLRAGVLAGLLVALLTGVAVACVNGLETAPFAAFVALGLSFHIRARSPRDEGLAGLALALPVLVLAVPVHAVKAAWFGSLTPTRCSPRCRSIRKPAVPVRGAAS